MRTAFIKELRELARANDDIVLVTAECGFSVTEGFAEEFPARYFNTGIAEQSMVGTTAGIALRGLRPVGYTMAMFLTMRAFEQIRVDVSYQNLPVILAGVGSGLGYGNAGTTHHATEDIALMRTLPNLAIFVPSCETDVKAGLRAALARSGPSYFSLVRGTAGFTVPYGVEAVVPGKAIRMTDGADAAIFTCGSLLPVAMEAEAALRKEGVDARVYNMHTVKPFDADTVLLAAKECGALFSLEEGVVNGGLGSAMAECLAEARIGMPFRRLGIADQYLETSGNHAWLRAQYGIDAKGVVKSVKEVLTRG